MAFETYSPDMVKEIHSQLHENKLPDVYCDEWPDTRATLIALKKFTPDPVDKMIDEIVAAGDKTCGNS